MAYRDAVGGKIKHPMHAAINAVPEHFVARRGGQSVHWYGSKIDEVDTLVSQLMVQGSFEISLGQLSAIAQSISNAPEQ